MKKFPRLPPPWLKFLSWGLALPLVVLNIWVLLQILDYFQSPIRIFIIANLIAFILGYPVRWLQRHPRIQLTQAVLIVCVATFLLIGAIAVLVIPLLIHQINQLMQSLPDWVIQGSHHLKFLDQWAVQWPLPTNFRQVFSKLSEQLPEQFQSILGEVFSFIIRTTGGIFEAIFIIVITVYLLLRGQDFWQGIFSWLPPTLEQPIRQSLRQSFQNYYIGQATVATLLGFSLIVSFTLAQIPFGLLFGLIIGLMALFPFGGGVSITVLSLVAALNNFWLGVKVLIIATLVDQLVENAIAPRLLGKFTGVHPVWVLLSLIIGAKVAGVLGVLVAVPCTSFIKDMLDLLRPKDALPRPTAPTPHPSSGQS